VLIQILSNRGIGYGDGPDHFYVMGGTVAATLTGLLFVAGARSGLMAASRRYACCYPDAINLVEGPKLKRPFAFGMRKEKPIPSLPAGRWANGIKSSQLVPAKPSPNGNAPLSASS
jgi:hypothetical protein